MIYKSTAIVYTIEIPTTQVTNFGDKDYAIKS